MTPPNFDALDLADVEAVRRYVVDYARRSGWSDATVTDLIVAAYAKGRADERKNAEQQFSEFDLTEKDQ